MEDRSSDLLFEADGIGMIALERQPEQRDAVRDHGQIGRPLRSGHPLVQAVEHAVGPEAILEELFARRQVLDDDHDLVERPPERIGDVIEGPID
jgi:hypothetical protein